MRVQKRDGQFESVNFNKITKRISYLSENLEVDPIIVGQKICSMLFDGVKTNELDILTSQVCASMSVKHPDYNILAGRVAIDNHQKQTCGDFIKVTKLLYDTDILSDDYYKAVIDNEEEIKNIIDYERDFLIDFFGFKTLEKGYLLKINNMPIERLSDMWMRVAIGIHFNDMNGVKETYNLMSQKYFTHATPTLFNAGLKCGQLSSCFLLDMQDSVDGIFKTLSDCAKISKWSGGIGVNISNIRAKGSKVKGTGGKSDGILPLLRTYNATARHINQGGKRLGSFAMYMEPHHADVFDFLSAKKNHGAEEERARDLFYALWISDLFMERVEKNEDWCLMCPSVSTGLNDVYGEEYKQLYKKYEEEGTFVKKIKARKVWDAIIESQIETGTPYMLYKDHVNRKSNQKNVGVIKQSNLCVAPYTLILTKRCGYIPICDVIQEEVWNGKTWSMVNITKTNENQKLTRVHFNNGVHIDCTSYHKFPVVVKSVNNQSKMEMIPTHKLNVGDTLLGFSLPRTHRDFCRSNYTYGVLSTGVDCRKFNQEIKNYMTGQLKPKCDINSASYMAGVMDACGSYIESDNTISIYCENNDMNIKYFYYLQCLGIHSIIKTVGKIKERGNERDIKIIKIPITDYFKRLFLGLFKKKSLSKNILECKSTPNDNYEPKITLIEPIDGEHDTFCFSEPKRHMGMFGGVLTGQCAEVALRTDNENTAVCNLASIGLPSYVKDVYGKKMFDFDKLINVTRVITRNLNKVIDTSFYPIPEAKHSNETMRPIGIGVQGLADVFIMMRYPYDSPEAKKLNRDIFETIYYAAMVESCNLAIETGPYKYFAGSPLSEGKFQFDLWDVKPELYDWDTLRQNVMTYGVKNSMLLSPMPTASTSQILGNNEAFEALTSNVYVRRTLAGEYTIVNKFMVKDLIKLGIWNDEMKDMIVYFQGSIQHIPDIPDDIKALYKTAWELKQKVFIDLAADRGAYVCQTQSLNMFVEDISYNKLTNIHFYGWKRGLKTGSYYVRSRPAISAQNFVIDPSKEKKYLEMKETQNKKSNYDCIVQDDGTELCVMCSG